MLDKTKHKIATKIGTCVWALVISLLDIFCRFEESNLYRSMHCIYSLLLLNTTPFRNIIVTFCITFILLSITVYMYNKWVRIYKIILRIALYFPSVIYSNQSNSYLYSAYRYNGMFIKFPKTKTKDQSNKITGIDLKFLFSMCNFK